MRTREVGILCSRIVCGESSSAGLVSSGMRCTPRGGMGIGIGITLGDGEESSGMKCGLCDGNALIYARVSGRVFVLGCDGYICRRGGGCSVGTEMRGWEGGLVVPITC